MIVSIKTDKLKIGMFVDLSKAWLENPFWKDQFLITSEEEIKRIINAGIKEVNIDTSKGITIEDSTNKKALAISAQNKEILTGTKEIIVDKKVDRKTIEDTGTKGSEGLTINKSPTTVAPTKWEPEKFMPKDLVQAVEDKRLPSEKRAKVVYTYSLEIMKHILETPTAETICAAKEGIAQIVDVILHEDETAQRLFKVASHDFYTYTHSVNVGVKSILIARALFKRSSNHNMHELGNGFFLHDLGKVNIDPAIINKRGRLTKEEMDVMRTHPYQGYKLLSDMKQLSTEAWIIAMQHHEQDDGMGYPRRLSGSEIHPYARICQIADVFDALTAERSYKKSLQVREALKVMKEEMISHFNKDIFEKFISLFK